MLRSFSLFLVAFLFMATACQKELSFDTLGSGTVTPPPTTGTAPFKMKIGGVQWAATKRVEASLLAGFTSIEGLSADGKLFSLFLDDTIPGTYTLNQLTLSYAELSDSSDQGGKTYSTDQGNSISDGGGTVIVTGVDKVKKTISGTFQMKLFRTQDAKQKVITEGSFDKIPYTSALPPASITDTFQVKIDNTDWSAKSISTGLTSGGELFINASELNVSRSVGFFIPKDIPVGTYDLSGMGAYIALYNPNLTTFLSAESGKLTILEHNLTTKRIRGNFNFKAVESGGTRSATLTSGFFSLKHQ